MHFDKQINQILVDHNGPLAWGHHKTHIPGPQLASSLHFKQLAPITNHSLFIKEDQCLYFLPQRHKQWKVFQYGVKFHECPLCKATCTEHLIKFSLIYKLLQVIFLQFLTVLAAQQFEYVQQ